MKKTMLLFCLQMATLICIAQSISIKKGTKLSYTVTTTAGASHPFIVTVERFSMSGIKFKWQMAGESKGTVTIYKNALENARVYKNYFADGSSIKLTKESTVWLSKINFNELTKSSESSIALDFTLQKFKKLAAEKYTVPILGKSVTLTTLVAKSSDSENKLQVLNESSNPLIVYMKVKDFTIELKKVE